MDLIQQMLTKDEKKRISAADAVNHPWFSQLSNDPIDQGQSELLIKNIQKSTGRNIIHQAALSYMAQLYMNDEMKQEMDNLFIKLDKDHSGTLSKIEIENHLKDIHSTQLSQQEIDKLIDNMDADKNGIINYNEFIAAVVD